MFDAETATKIADDINKLKVGLLNQYDTDNILSEILSGIVTASIKGEYEYHLNWAKFQALMSDSNNIDILTDNGYKLYTNSFGEGIIKWKEE